MTHLHPFVIGHWSLVIGHCSFRPPTWAVAFALLLTTALHSAANPLNLTPGTPATVTLGQIQTLANFNTSLGSGEIAYSNPDLATRQYVVRLPAGFDPADPAKRYGIVTFIDAGDAHTFPAAYAAALDAHDVIWLGGLNIGNTQSVNTRMGVALMGAFRLSELYPLDPARLYVSGLSGGGRTASSLAYLRNDYFTGFIGRVGASIPGIIPGWESAGNNSANSDADYELGSGSSVVLPPSFRTAIITQYGDFRRAENLAIYRWGHLNHGNSARAFVRPGGHSDTVGASFTEALRFFHHPLVDVIWDRFENNLLAANVHPGKTAAGSGFTALSGDVSETTYTHNSVNHGVLRLAGDGALAQANDAFSWKHDSGLLLDARLRSQAATTANQNQQIGLHLVSEDSTGPVASRPGFHLYWCYGAPYRAEIVSISGLRRTLATWEHAATHPMALAATDKTFWGDTAAPDFAGKSKSFRGEDVRLALNATGFQLTFNRYANNLQTTYPGVVLTSNDPTSTPFAEHIPMVLQGFWSEVETALFNALPAGDYRLLFSNSALTPGQPVGTAVVDELRLVGSSGQQAAPATLAVTASNNTTRSLAWATINGASAYRIQRSTTPDSGFADLVTLPATASTRTDTVPSNIAYYYRVAALALDGTVGRWSAVAFAKRNPSLPATPTGLAVTYPAAFQARLAWTDAATTETAYRVERSPAGFAQWTLVSGLLAANTTVFLDTTVAAGSAYDYRVSALNADGLSAYASLTASVPDAAPPTPAGLAVTATAFTSASLSWTAVPAASSYRVKRASSVTGPFTLVASGLATSTYTDTSLSPGQTYHYVVSSVGAALESANSASVPASTPALLAPTDLAVTPGFTTNTLSWTAAPGVSAYLVQHASATEGPFTTLVENHPSTSFTDTGLPTGVTRFYRVLSVAASAQSTPTATLSGTPFPGTFTKANNTTALDQTSSWSPSGFPSLADTVSWTGTYASGTVSIGSGLSTGTLRLASPSTAITVNSDTGPLTLGAGGIDLSASTQNLTVNAPVVLAAPQSWTLASGRTFTFAVPITASSGTPTLTFSGAGTFSYDAANTTTPFPGPLVASGGTFRVNQASAVATLNATNLPAASTNSFTSVTGASGATLILDAAPTAALAFASNSAGFNLVLKNGALTYNALTGSTDATNVRVEGGTFTVSSSSARYQLAAANQTFQLLGGTVDVSQVTSFGLRVGGSGSASQSGAQNVTATQSGGTLLTTTLNLGGTNTTASTSPSYTLSGGLLALSSTASNAFVIGADTLAAGSSTFTFSGGTLRLPGTLAGAQTSARQIFAMSGGTLAAATLNFTHLRSTDASANGTFTQAAGILAPGDLGTAGRTVVTGNYVLGASASLAVDIGGTTQASAYQNGQYDFVSVSGTTTFSGSLALRLINGFTPSNASTFTVLNSTGTLTGTFGQRLATTGGEGSFLVTQVGNTVRLSDYQPALTALQSWRQTHFGQTANTGDAADTFDFDADGLVNLLEYALGTNPLQSSPEPHVRITNIADHLALTFTRIADPSLIYTVEASSTLAPDSWTSIWTSTGSANVSGEITVTDPEPVSENPRRFLRLRVTTP